MDEADEEVQQWAAAARVSHLLPKLSQGGFKEMVAVCLIDANDIALMDITKPGDIKLLLRAVQQAIKASGEPGPCDKPQIDLFWRLRQIKRWGGGDGHYWLQRCIMFDIQYWPSCAFISTKT